MLLNKLTDLIMNIFYFSRIELNYSFHNSYDHLYLLTIICNWKYYISFLLWK